MELGVSHVVKHLVQRNHATAGNIHAADRTVATFCLVVGDFGAKVLEAAALVGMNALPGKLFQDLRRGKSTRIVRRPSER